ncbi:MAG: lipoprotein [Candidatus Accumulibacter sp.]|nr:lipoprotein [Accumulibacter sp.]
MRRARIAVVFLLLSAMALSACGTRGSLYLPSPPSAPGPAAPAAGEP